MSAPQTAVEKIATRFAVGLRPGEQVYAGDFIAFRPRHIMTHDNTGAVIPKFQSVGATRIADPRQPVFAMDHDIQNTTPENLGKYAKIQKFAREHGVTYYPPGRGIAHQVMVEEGFVTPGTMVVGSDSHSNLYGAIAALGTPVVRTDAAAVWATGQTWWQIPEQVRVTLHGRLRPGVSGKDVIITLCGHFNNDEVLNASVEFAGEGVASLSVDERMTISNMSTEWGALVGYFPFDQTLREYLLARADSFRERGDNPPRYTRKDVERWWEARIESDDGAYFAKELDLDLATVSPHVSGPNSVKVMAPLSEIEAQDVRIDRAYLMSCVNARLSDIEEAASIFRASPGAPARRVAEGVKFYVAAASSEVQAEAERRGYWQTLVEAGADILPPGCGACIGLGRGTLEPGEVGISATNRNFQGRMGSRDALCYLGSPAVVAASAIAGKIASPERVAPRAVHGSCRVVPRPARAREGVEIIEGFPKSMTGRAVYLPLDNLNTDGIYGKDVTYRDDITLEQQGQFAMLNYDPQFQQLARRGDILVGGRNFGTGSSREQAATALASFGIQCVIAATFSETYARNAYNNGFLLLACPELVDALAAQFAGQEGRTIIGPTITIDYARSAIAMDGREFGFPALSPVAQELVVAGGAEEIIRRQLAKL